MIRKKVYIFFTYDITSVGGTQMYTAGKVAYLQKLGWQVFIFFTGTNKESSDIPALNPFVKSGSVDFLHIPPYKMYKDKRERCLRQILQRLNASLLDKREIIIESHTDTQAYWAEIIASILKARHFFVACNEVYRNYFGCFYDENLDFFYFKWRRNEIIHEDDVLKLLFNGYKDTSESLREMPPTIREQDPIQDVDFPIEKIQRLDWNICHIGRAQKDYFPHVIKGVGELARQQPDKSINFILVGNVDKKLDLFTQTFNGLTNVHLTLLGALVPIPRILFSKVDVVCAISQTALFTANEDVLTICASVTDEKRSPGVLGYDTEDAWYGEGTFSYVEALENVLVKRLYDGKKSSMPKLKPAEEYYKNFWLIAKNAAPVGEYYAARLSEERIRNWTAIFPFAAIARDTRIILFGETKVAKDYRIQINSQESFTAEFSENGIKQIPQKPYCRVVATVDEHPEDFDDSVVGLERLTVLDYDAIIICTAPVDAQAACDKIIQIVPNMADRIIYGFQAMYI